MKLLLDECVVHDQQNIRLLQIGVLILMSRGTTYADLKPLVPEVLAALSTIKPGEFLLVE